MPSRPARPAHEFVRRGERVALRHPRAADERAFLAAAAASRRLHGSWVRPPDASETFRSYVQRYGRAGARDRDTARQVGYVLCERATGALVGVFNVSEIIRGALLSAFLGYYAFEGMHGRGYMREGLGLVLDEAFGPLGLHRLEVNVQPANARSIALVEALRFTREGFSRRYVKIAGRWRDHVRFAMLAEDWRLIRRARET
jgi:ribosomal-protein-alanine N-acetyltransferase